MLLGTPDNVNLQENLTGSPDGLIPDEADVNAMVQDRLETIRTNPSPILCDGFCWLIYPQ